MTRETRSEMIRWQRRRNILTDKFDDAKADLADHMATCGHWSKTYQQGAMAGESYWHCDYCGREVPEAK